MNRLLLFALIVILVCSCGAALSQTPTIRPGVMAKPAEPFEDLSPPDPAVLQKLRAPVTKQVLINTLMSDPKTKSGLVQEGGKLGFSEAQLQRVTSVRLPAPGTFDPTVDQVEVAYRALDWHSGFSFALDNIPTYGPTNRKLGALRLYPSKAYSIPLTYPCINPGNRVEYYAAILDVELPTEPALYAVTVKISRWYAPCYPNWLTPKSGHGMAPLSVQFKEGRAGTAVRTTPITLTALPDGYGYVGIISASPGNPLAVSGVFGMRKSTAQIILSLNPLVTRPGEEMGDLMFRGFTITRL